MRFFVYKSIYYIIKTMRDNLFRVAKVLVVVSSFVFVSCSSSDDGEGMDKGKHVATISGVAQKGQFLRGSSVTVYSLDNALNATGLSYPTQTIDDMGTFVVNNVDANFIDVKANGYYYNENRGATSESTISLQALAASDSKVNVNLLTTLAYNRIKRLVRDGANFADAQRRAQDEVLAALGLGKSTTTDFVDMNIAGSGDANGLLLAASLLIQQNRNSGDVSKLIFDIAADLEEDGLLGGELNEEVHRYERDVYVGDVIDGLLSFYDKNKVKDYAIPPFYKFLDSDGDGQVDGTADYIFKNISVDEICLDEPYNPNRGYEAGGFTRSLKFLSTIPFQVRSDVEWLTVSQRLVCENIYAVDIMGQRNTGENRTGHVQFTDATGRELATYAYQQKAPDQLVAQRFFIGCSTEMENLPIEQIGANGKAYAVATLPNDANYLYGYTRYIDIPYADKQERYQAYFPTDMLSMPDGYGTYRLTIPQSFTSDRFPFISQRENSTYGDIHNPDFLRFVQAAPCVVLDFVTEDVDHVVLTSETQLTGTANYTISQGAVDFGKPQADETTAQPDEKGRYSLTVKIRHHVMWGNRYYVPVLLPDARVTIQYYMADGTTGVEQGTMSRNFNLAF